MTYSFPTRRSTELETAAGVSANKSLNENHERTLFSEKFACPVSGFTISEIEPRLFSFNNPFGACPTCDGLGFQQKIDVALIIPEPERTLRDGAISPWAKRSEVSRVGTECVSTCKSRWSSFPSTKKKTTE